ncbi:hypothetical protein CYLTODRAFT_460529 [Cylindrobasidium torrendii FP15055 ss-10]|uniref:Uncharacterized protein n=1 Tax=Cylindrobasidium torrendii FP15055 ss-10 TaxID=1314674 RepID=A0A0D7AR52_9AGAR|nr:hypothetical protein CYLTODRAFT_460529 [Cylindrobasidium torrendii FP15055 ss-10]
MIGCCTHNDFPGFISGQGRGHDKVVYDGKFGVLTKAALNKALNILGDEADKCENDINPNEQDNNENGFLDAEHNELLSGSDDKYTITIAVHHIPQDGTHFVQDEDTGTTDILSGKHYVS